MTGTVPETVFFMFQMTFAIITPALVIGGFAERMRFSAVLGFTVLWLLLVYVPIAHWVWGGGWLAQLGVMDFAGGIVVHVNAGVAALVCALVLGRRAAFRTRRCRRTACRMHGRGRGHAVGRLVRLQRRQRARGQWLGRHGDARHAPGRVGRRAGLDVRRMEAIRQAAMLGMVTGMVAGLGTITPASGFVGPMGAVVIGSIAGVVCFFATQFLKRKLQIDDSLDVSPVHGVGGVIGTLADRRVRRRVAGRRGIQVQTRRRCAARRAGAGCRGRRALVRRCHLGDPQGDGCGVRPARHRRAGDRRSGSRRARRARVTLPDPLNSPESSMPRAIRIHETGGPEVMRLEDVEVGAPGAGEVQVRHTAIGLNFIDCLRSLGAVSAEVVAGRTRA